MLCRIDASLLSQLEESFLHVKLGIPTSHEPYRIGTPLHSYFMAAFLPSPFLRPQHHAATYPATAPARPRFRCAAEPPPQKTKNLLASHSSILPYLVRVARTSYSLFWRVLMSQLAPSDPEGNYIRPKSSISDSADPTDPLSRAVSDVLQEPSEPHAKPPLALYVGLACQWCHRTMLARALLRMTDTVELRYLQPGSDGLWILEQPQADDATLLRDVYLRLDKSYEGRFTAPLLTHTHQQSIVSNESADILKMLAGKGPIELSDGVVVFLNPPRDNDFGVDTDHLRSLCNELYECINDGVYRCGFATSQTAYQQAHDSLFNALDHVESLLEKSRFLCSPTVITEADVRLFPTVFRFDAVYAVLFKATGKSIRADYPAISLWIRGTLYFPVSQAKSILPPPSLIHRPSNDFLNFDYLPARC